MKGLITVLAVLVVVGLAYFLYRSPTAPPEMTDAEMAQIEAEVLAFADDWTAAFNEQRADRLTGFWVEGNVSSVSFADRIVGLEEIAAFYQNLLSDRVATEMEWLPGSVVDVINNRFEFPHCDRELSLAAFPTVH